MKDKISIIMPVYNVAEYLPRCLSSIKNQTYCNLEVLCIDDGSTDGSGAILDAFAENDQRFHVYHQENLGTSAARNKALEYVSGDYIGFVDSDDWIEPDMYERLYLALTESGADIVTCGYYIDDEGG